LLNGPTHPASDIVSVSAQDTQDIADELKHFVAAAEFPCVGAKAALRRHQLEIVVVSDIRRNAYDRFVTQHLQNFAGRQDLDETLFVSQAVIYRCDRALSESEFETYLWQRLSALHAIDREHFRWDPNVDSDPNSPHFSLSIGGKGFFVVGLHPNASRIARRFKYPTLVFNLHAQFEKLREEGRYESIRNKTIERDVALQGYPNPMLSRHGERPEAAQYSGRSVEAGWKCPFRHA
jgi:FPC/CPF motif-containing protein YcgG